MCKVRKKSCHPGRHKLGYKIVSQCEDNAKDRPCKQKLDKWRDAHTIDSKFCPTCKEEAAVRAAEKAARKKAKAERSENSDSERSDDADQSSGSETAPLSSTLTSNSKKSVSSKAPRTNYKGGAFIKDRKNQSLAFQASPKTSKDSHSGRTKALDDGRRRERSGRSVDRTGALSSTRSISTRGSSEVWTDDAKRRDHGSKHGKHHSKPSSKSKHAPSPPLPDDDQPDRVDSGYGYDDFQGQPQPT